MFEARCTRCGRVSHLARRPASGELVCPSCGQSIATEADEYELAHDAHPAPRPPVLTGSHAAPRRPATTSGEAIASLILGILGLTSCGFLGLLAIYFGNRAKEDIAASRGAVGGEGMATAGVIMGYISAALLVLISLLFCFALCAGMGGSMR